MGIRLENVWAPPNALANGDVLATQWLVRAHSGGSIVQVRQLGDHISRQCRELFPDAEYRIQVGTFGVSTYFRQESDAMLLYFALQ